MRLTESIVEEAALAHGPEIVEPERGGDYGRVVLTDRLRAALVQLNPKGPASAIEEVFRKLTIPDSLVGGNHAMHRLLTEGVPVAGRAV